MIFGISKKKNPEDVFQPRAPRVNPAMYVDRSDLEDRFKDYLVGSKHIVVHGESGNGKSWLYKKVLADERIPYVTVNLASAARHKSIAEAIRLKIAEVSGDETSLAQIVVNVEAGVMPGGIGAKAAQQRLLKVLDQDPLTALMKYVSDLASRKRSFIVFDNFEAILEKEELINELASMIILLDDEDLACHNVKYIIVGVPSGIKDYLGKVRNTYSVSNRLSELPEVARLTKKEAEELLRRGFLDQLQLKVGPDSRVFERILYVTDRIAEHMHELGLEVARLAVKGGGTIDDAVLAKAEERWFEETISASRAVVEENINSIETKAGRRNQAIFAIGSMAAEEFRPADVETEVRRLFPETTKDINLNMFQTVSELSTRETPLLKRAARAGTYRIINPKAKIAIRLMLEKRDEKIVEVRSAS